MLTIFSTPKPFRGHTNIIQRNAIESWVRLGYGCEIILFGNEDGAYEVATELGIKHVPEISRDEYGTPLINVIFETAQKVGKYDFFCYVNADIILMSDLIKAVEQVYEQMPQFLLIGQRWDIDINEPLDFSIDWENKLRSRIINRGQLHSPRGIDYFVFTRGLWGEIPPFVVGRPAWDNWMLYQARFQKTALIDATQVVMAVHQKHDYAHVPGGTIEVWKGPQAKINLELARGLTFGIDDANWLLTAQGMIRSIKPWYSRRARETWLLLHHPGLYVLYKKFRKLLFQLRRHLQSLLRKVRRPIV